MAPIPGIDGCWFVKILEDPLNATSAIQTSRPTAWAPYSLVVRTRTNKGFGRWIKTDATEVWSYAGEAPLTITTAAMMGQ